MEEVGARVKTQKQPPSSKIDAMWELGKLVILADLPQYRLLVVVVGDGVDERRAKPRRGLRRARAGVISVFHCA